MRSDPATIRRAVHAVIRNRPMPNPIVIGHRSSNITTPLQRRKQNTDNYRDLSDCVRHLTYHICPFANSSEAWQWNLEQLRQRWHLFNGLKVLGINHDESTVQPGVLLKHCEFIGLHWDHVVVRPNSRALGEVMTWIPSLEFLNPETANENEVVFSAHAKGVKYGAAIPPTILKWNQVMYSVNLDDWSRVRESLEWFIATGAFRCRGSRVHFCKHAWYYSGAFWWWRLRDLGQREWREVGQWYPGREVWIGHHVERHESGCLFMDNSRSPYKPEFWNSVVTPRWKKYQEMINAR